jgi:hypothetical protein
MGRFFADILLTPLEATRIRLVSDPKVSMISLLSGAQLTSSTPPVSFLVSQRSYLPKVWDRSMPDSSQSYVNRSHTLSVNSQSMSDVPKPSITKCPQRPRPTSDPFRI